MTRLAFGRWALVTALLGTARPALAVPTHFTAAGASRIVAATCASTDRAPALPAPHEARPAATAAPALTVKNVGAAGRAGAAALLGHATCRRAHSSDGSGGSDLTVSASSPRAVGCSSGDGAAGLAALLALAPLVARRRRRRT